MGETIHQHKIHLVFFPVKALARRVHHILSHDGTTANLLCDVWDESNDNWTYITPSDMISGIRKSIKKLKLEKQGIVPNLVGVHSLCTGGAMAMKMNRASDTTIMKQG